MYLGTSIGIAIRGNHLEVVCLRGRGRRVTVSGFLRIEDFLTRPVGEVAQQYQRFRKENHALTSSAMVALPRGAGLLRILDLPAEVAPNLAQAVAYQVDSLHPFEEGSVYFDYAVLPEPPAEAGGNGTGAGSNGQRGRLRVAVALVERGTLDRLYQWCCQAGIDVAGFTFSTAALYQALNGPGGRRPLVVLSNGGETQGEPALEILGIAADGAFYSKEVASTAPLPREIEFCAAELRVQREENPFVLSIGDGTLPPIEWGQNARLGEGFLAVTPEVRPAGRESRPRQAEFRLREHFVAYAAALTGLERRLPGMAPPPGLRWNLLPVEKRIYRSHWAYTAAYVLAALVLALGATWAATGWVQDRLYASWLNSEINRLAPRVQYLERLDSRQQSQLLKLGLLQGQKQDITQKLEAWRELTRLLPATAWLQSLQFTENQVLASGQADAASGLLQLINQSAYFQQPEFLGAIAKNAEGKEVFQVRMRLREVAVAPPVPAPPAPLSSAVPAGAGAPAAAAPPGAVSPAASAGASGALKSATPGAKGGK